MASTGSVGIGTSTPGGNLHVKSSGGALSIVDSSAASSFTSLELRKNGVSYGFLQRLPSPDAKSEYETSPEARSLQPQVTSFHWQVELKALRSSLEPQVIALTRFKNSLNAHLKIAKSLIQRSFLIRRILPLAND